MGKKILFFFIIMSATIMAIQTNFANAQTPAAQPAAVKPAVRTYQYPGMNANYGTYYNRSNMYRTGRQRIGLGFDGIPFNGSHREAIQKRRAYRYGF